MCQLHLSDNSDVIRSMLSQSILPSYLAEFIYLHCIFHEQLNR